MSSRLRTTRHVGGAATLFLLCLVPVAATAQSVVACTAEAVRLFEGCPATGDCWVVKDYVCDDTCGTECVYAFNKDGPAGAYLEGSFRSTGPAMRFQGYVADMTSRITSRPMIETTEGGSLIFDEVEMVRPIRAPGGSIEVQGTPRSNYDVHFLGTQLDVSSRVAGGTIHLRRGMDSVSLLARGLGSAVGGHVIIDEPATLNGHTAGPAPGPWKGIHRIDVTGSSGGTIELVNVWLSGDILARGRSGAGGSITMDASTAPIGNDGTVLGDCNTFLQWPVGRSAPGSIDVSGRTTGGALTVRGGYPSICQRIIARGPRGGGTVSIESEAAEFREIDLRGSQRGPGGTFRYRGRAAASISESTINVSGNPGGFVDVAVERQVNAWRILADGIGSGAAAGRVFLSAADDPPDPASGIDASSIIRNGYISAVSVDGSGGQVTLRNCRVLDGAFSAFDADVTIDVGGTNALLLLQGQRSVELDRIRATASGLGSKVRVEYGQTYISHPTAPPPAELFQYPNPACDCARTLAECMTPP